MKWWMGETPSSIGLQSIVSRDVIFILHSSSEISSRLRVKLNRKQMHSLNWNSNKIIENSVPHTNFIAFECKCNSI